MKPTPPHILFVCGRNRWRSPTAEQLYRHDPRLLVRSAGVGAGSRHPLSADDLAWADLVLVMEPAHKTRILAQFRLGRLPVIESLDIPDDYQYMDAELIELIRSAVEPRLDALGGPEPPQNPGLDPGHECDPL